jgi:small subunit ribosomal protein S12
MATYNQLARGVRGKKKKYIMCKALQRCPHKKGVCVRVYNTKPKKPNSAQRKVAKVKLSNGYHILAYIPGQGHTLQQHSAVFIRGGRVKDLPGVHYHIIRNKEDFRTAEKFIRSARRSKFGISKPKTKA